jgi:hypothetical protein
MCDGRMKKKTPAKDVNVNAFEILQVLTRKPAEGPTEKKNPEKLSAAVALGRLEGLKGGRLGLQALRLRSVKK